MQREKRIDRGTPSKGKIVFFATDNINKFNEARKILAEYKVAVGMLRVKTPEIQNEDLEKIAQRSASDAFARCKLPIIVEDAGLFIEKLNGFPGPYSAYVYKTIGNNGLLKLLEKERKRKAEFKSIIAYRDNNSEIPISFEGSVNGEITLKEQKKNRKSGFGFDPIFKPEYSNKTFAEMNIEEKNNFSHRAKAIHKFAHWYQKLETKNKNTKIKN